MSAIVLDCETTGFNPHEDRITEIAIVNFDDGLTLLHTLINPQRPISEEITRITRIDNELVKDSPTFADVAGDIAQILGSADAFIGHNPYFDRGFLSCEFARCGISPRFPLLICTKRIWDIYEPREERHLMNAFKRFVSREGFENAHGALQDTRATRAVARAQLEEFELMTKKWDEIDPEQTKWWGPSNHVIIVDGVLVFNVGKNKGTPCHAVEKSFWRWLLEKDFPEHVKTLADYLTVVRPEISPEELYSWAYSRFS